MQLVFLATTILFTIASAAMTKFEKPMVEVYYTDGQQTQRVEYDYDRCVALAPQPGVWIYGKRLSVKSRCNYYEDSMCNFPARPYIDHEPGEYKVDRVNKYAKCTLA